MTIIYTPKQRHTCALPLSRGLSHGTVWRCDECRSHWVLWTFREGDAAWYGEGLISKVRRWLKGARRVR